MNKKYQISFEAVLEILQECFCRGYSGETGGILVGPKDQEYVITDFIPSSHHAEREAATYYQTERDVDQFNRTLRRFQAVGKDFKGYIHKHPSGMCMLSHGDLGTCFGILNSPNYRINNHLVMLIATEAKTGLPLFAYKTSLDSNGTVVVGKMGIEILPQKEIDQIINTNKGANNEDIRTEHDSRSTDTEREGNSVRPQGKRQNRRLLPDGGIVA